MNKKTENSIRKMNRAQLAAEREEYQAILTATPDDAEAKEIISLIDELLAQPESEDGEASAADKLKELAADDKAIKEMVAGGLDHNQAVAALRHKKDFAKRHAEVKGEKKK